MFGGTTQKGNEQNLQRPQSGCSLEEPCLHRQGFFDTSGGIHIHIRSLTPPVKARAALGMGVHTIKGSSKRGIVNRGLFVPQHGQGLLAQDTKSGQKTADHGEDERSDHTHQQGWRLELPGNVHHELQENKG